jgi:hypothetical protein
MKYNTQPVKTLAFVGFLAYESKYHLIRAGNFRPEHRYILDMVYYLRVLHKEI